MQTQDQQTANSPISDGAEIVTIFAGELGEYWPTIVKFLLMIDAPDWTIDDVFEAIRKKEAQVWGFSENGEIKGIWITRIEKGRYLYGLVWIASGKGLERGVNLFLSHTETWFKEIGCKEIRLYGRKGWIKALPGFREHLVELRKQL